MKGVVELLGDIEEAVIATYHVPARPDTEFIKHRDQAVQYLRDAAADGRGVDVLDSLVPQALGKQV